MEITPIVDYILENEEFNYQTQEAKIMQAYLRLKGKKSQWSGCILEGYGQCSKLIINAHSIQNNRILNRISEKGKVLYHGDNANFFEDSLEKQLIGRNQATTFTGFCKKHDEVFNPVEHVDYIPMNREQEYLFAYRAFAKEYHLYYSSMNFFTIIKELLIDSDNSMVKTLESRIAVSEKAKEGREFRKRVIIKKNEERLQHIGKQLKKLESCKTMMNMNLLNRKFYKVDSFVFEFQKEYHIAVSSMFYIYTDLEGKQVNNIEKGDLKYPLFLSIFPQQGKTYIIVSFLKKDKNFFQFFRNQVQTKPEIEQQVIFSNIIVKYCGNMAYSPNSYRNLTSMDKLNIDKQFRRRTQWKNEPLNSIRDINLFQ